MLFFCQVPVFGAGRLLTLEARVPVSTVVSRVKAHLCLPHLSLALPSDWDEEKLIGTIAVCAGSGSSVLHEVKADMFITGESYRHLEESHTTLMLCLSLKLITMPLIGTFSSSLPSASYFRSIPLLRLCSIFFLHRGDVASCDLGCQLPRQCRDSLRAQQHRAGVPACVPNHASGTTGRCGGPHLQGRP